MAEPPEDENDADFEAMLLASNAQSAEVERLAAMFRTGVADGAPYNLKDLLVEIVLSPWFRAESMSDDDPVRMAALRNAGGERLLTPEELVWKTESITGYSWGRELVDVAHSYIGSGIDYTYAALGPGGPYHLLYGGIDSDGITERTGDMTAVMAAVAQRHAAEVSCPVVRREFFFLPDEDRHLLGGIDMSVTPVVDKTVSFEITSENWRAPQTVSFQVVLDPGSRTIRLAFTNDHWGGEDDDRNLYLDRMEVRSSNGRIVKTVEFESIQHEQDCGTYWLSHKSYKFWDNCSLEIPVEVSVSDDYTIEVGAFQDQGGDDPAMLIVSVESDIETSQGAKAIRNKLVELYEKLLGVTVTADSPDIEAAFRLFVEVWEKGRPDGWNERTSKCPSFRDALEFDGIINPPPFDEEGRHDWNRLGEIYREVGVWEFHGSGIFRAWVVVLAYLLADYRYLFH